MEDFSDFLDNTKLTVALICHTLTSGSVADPWHFGGGSGSADPGLGLMDPDPAIFVIDLQDASKNKFFYKIFSAYYFLKVHLHHFSKIKSQKESLNSRNQGFSYYFCMMIEGSGSGSGSIPLTSESGSGAGRPKNMWIRWIRIRNTDFRYMLNRFCCIKICTFFSGLVVLILLNYFIFNNVVTCKVFDEVIICCLCSWYYC
jgi:hypothetical protein